MSTLTIRESATRGPNLTRLAEAGRMDLLWEVVWTLWLLEVRRITMQEVQAHLHRSRTWLDNTLSAVVGPEVLQANLLEVDRAITEITAERKEQA